MERPSSVTSYCVDERTARLLRLVVKTAFDGDSEKAWERALKAMRSRCEPSADGYVRFGIPALSPVLRYAPPEAAEVARRMWDVAGVCMRGADQIANALGVIHRRWKKDHDRRVARNRRRRAKVARKRG